MSEDSHYDKDAADHAVCFIENFAAILKVHGTANL